MGRRTKRGLLQSAELLVHFDPTKELILASDASNYGIEAVLSQRMCDGSERPIGYASRTLNTVERNYSTLKKEALAVLLGAKKFHQFLYRHKFTIKTDHKPLRIIERKERSSSAGLCKDSAMGPNSCCIRIHHFLQGGRKQQERGRLK